MPRNKKVLLLVENLSVPADPRVWREAQTLRQHGYQVSIICPRGETRDTESYACLDGIFIYRYTLDTTINKSTDYIREYMVAMLNTLRLSFKVWLRHGFDVIHAANPRTLFLYLEYSIVSWERSLFSISMIWHQKCSPSNFRGA
ncbi:glycosyltransferase [Dictyobacter kobayashii]|uniref:Uncharacterized protein n=1 Tax=Dictyobacter kobayashii TaxID=2014872 RepID=A0A402AE73_9CHLR|nr:glycosyltransferase [Dictyobacter kobayashii]GCE17408.1 hypothetical protein KDK_12080 [Dictyobacter kobayashii]